MHDVHIFIYFFLIVFVFSAEKRGDINRLIRRLIALYGTNDIEYSGRSTGLRFGPGGR